MRTRATSLPLFASSLVCSPLCCLCPPPPLPFAITVNHTVFTTKHPHHVVSTGLVDPILSIFAKLIESRSLDHEGFNIINSIVLHVPHDTVQTRMPMIMRLLFARLSKAKTVKYMKMLILFLSILVVTHGADWLIQSVEQLQSNMWGMLFRNVWAANVRKVEGQSSTNVCQIALVKLLAESTFMKQREQADLWVLGTRVLMAMVTNDSDVDNSQKHTEGKKYEFTSLVVAQLGSKVRPPPPLTQQRHFLTVRRRLHQLLLPPEVRHSAADRLLPGSRPLPVPVRAVCDPLSAAVPCAAACG